jgi:hypothetical protein
VVENNQGDRVLFLLSAQDTVPLPTPSPSRPGPDSGRTEVPSGA